MLYAIVLGLGTWLFTRTAVLARIEKQNRKIIDLLDDIKMKTVDADVKYDK